MWDNCQELSVTDISLQRVLQQAYSETSQNILIKKKQQRKIPTETCSGLIKEYVHSTVRDILVYVSQNALMKYTGEA